MGAKTINIQNIVEVCKIKGVITQNIADKFWVDCDGENVVCSGKKNLKASKLFVGDKVEVARVENGFQIAKLLPRNNHLIRPPVANVQKLFVVVCQIPEPDFFVIDKMLLFAFSNNIEPVILINKVDKFGFELFENVQSIYQNVCQTLCVSAKTGYNINVLKDEMRGCISAFAGQSAVGKSSLVNALVPNVELKTGELSQRIERGKNTTTHCKLCQVEKNSHIIDTPGFSLIDEYYLPIKFDELSAFYPDFVEFACGCKFKNTCDHIHEKKGDCLVQQKVDEGVLNKGRYERYKQIYEGLKNRWKNEHK